MKYRGKKLLILGGISHMVDIVNTAKNMGIYTIVTDYDPKSPAKLIADKSYDVSTIDIDKMLEIAKNEKVDGIINAFEDLNVWVAQELCEKLNLPFYATKEQLEVVTNKKIFKEYCREQGVPVIDEYFSGSNITQSDISKMKFPVIIKPVDSYGSKGISICYSEEELKYNYENSKKFSKSKEVIVEKFIDGKYGVEMYYTIQNRKVILSAMTDRYVYKQNENLPPLPIATVYPSSHLNNYIKNTDKKIRNMLNNMELENGVVLIQALVENEEFYIYEMAYRLTGEQHYQIIEKQTGINLLEMMIELSLGGNCDAYDISSFDDGYITFPSCNISILLNEGTIKKIEGLNEIIQMKEVISYIKLLDIGDSIEISGNYSQMFMRMNICAENDIKLKNCIKFINDKLRVISEKGENMILTYFNDEINK